MRASPIGIRASPNESGVLPASSSASRTDGAPASGLSTRVSSRLDAYANLLELQGAGRAKVWIGVGRDEATLERLVVIKRFEPNSVEATRRELELELDLATSLDHPNIIRTFHVEGIGSDDGCCAITQYLDGVTLSELLAWAAEGRRQIPETAVTCILTSMLEAVMHAQRGAPSRACGRLCNLPIAASDVFVTYAGRVQVLGFKPAHKWLGAGDEPAVDALVSAHAAPGLEQLLARCASDGGCATANEPRDMRHDGLTAVARLMKGVRPVARARQAGRLVSAFALWRGL